MKARMSPAVDCESTAMTHPRLPTMENYYKEQENTEATQSERKSGLLFMQLDSRKTISVRAKVYNNGLDHFLLMTSKSLLNSSQKYVNLKHTNLEVVEADNSIRITPAKDIDGQCLILKVSNEKDVASWVAALRPERSRTSSIGRTPLMPVLQESDEE